MLETGEAMKKRIVKKSPPAQVQTQWMTEFLTIF